ncbi:hypothetical protein OUZ56_006897 [Daphnia magna]|uniref:Uncharacterized protein n=1 Tax=Daphnia magna TaxID=35525 RepID=A0ABQ9YX19_9CRUS|nr:hypothetical protein OUZ56_006897 [Daphnia magna]
MNEIKTESLVYVKAYKRSTDVNEALCLVQLFAECSSLALAADENKAFRVYRVPHPALSSYLTPR